MPCSVLILAHLLILSSCPRDVPFSEVYIRDGCELILLRTSVNPSAQQSSLKKLSLPCKSESPHTLLEDCYILQRICTECCVDLPRQQGLALTWIAPRNCGRSMAQEAVCGQAAARQRGTRRYCFFPLFPA